MNARAVVQRKVREVVECEHRAEKMVLAFFSAAFSAVILRTICWALVTFGPAEAWAVEGAERIMAMNGPDFWMAVAIASWGGAASLFHELRSDILKFSVLNATGHMVIAQFAGVTGFLLVIYGELPWALGMLVCGVFGWGGNKTLMAVNTALLRRILGVNNDTGQRNP